MNKGSYLCVGHVCMDVASDGFTLGGTSSYSSLLANALGYQSAVLTSHGDDFEFVENFDGVDLHTIRSSSTTIFDNRYQGDDRTQILKAKAADIATSDFQKLNSTFDIIHFCPIAHEVDFDMIKCVPKETLTLATPQGWLRKWDQEGHVSFQNLDWEKLSEVDFVIISEEDVPNLSGQLDEIKQYVKNLIVTKGGQGATIHYEDKVLDFPAYKTKVVDPTGAGDTFATGFITKFAETRDISKSMIYANCLSSICVENRGTSFYESLDVVRKRVLDYRSKYEV